MKTVTVYNRAAIMRRAWQIARERREDIARRAYDAEVRIISSRIIHAKPFSTFLAETPLDLAGAMRTAWAEAKQGAAAPSANAVAIVREGALAPMRRRLRAGRVWRALTMFARFVGENFIRSRAA
jgi:hypothetical protein